MMFQDAHIVITGGTGSLGRALVRRLLTGEVGMPRRVVVFSRDEAKQQAMRIAYQRRAVATDEVIYRSSPEPVEFRIGDVRDLHSVTDALCGADVVVNAAALKQVPTCEYWPFEAVQTNIGGAENIVRAVVGGCRSVKLVVGISTDKACQPVNVMGMTKALQERVLTQANLRCPDTRFVCVRYGNVLASRGSVIPLFHDQIRAGGPLTITSPDMTRFLMSLDAAVDLVFAAAREACSGETFVGRAPAAMVTDIAGVLIGDREINTVITGVRPGEKMHEILISEDEARRTVERGRYYAIEPLLPELRQAGPAGDVLGREYSSADHLMSRELLIELLACANLLDPMAATATEEDYT